MKIIDYRKDNDRLNALRGIEIYPYLEPEQPAILDGNFQVYLDTYTERDSGYSEQHVEIRNNFAGGRLTIEQSRQFLLALSVAIGIALQWQLELDTLAIDALDKIIDRVG